MKPGDTAPDFALPSTHGEVQLAEQLRKGPVLLVFYPGDDTPVCTRQLCDYRDNLTIFEKLGVNVIAINAQALDSHASFSEKHDLPFPLASDPDREVCRAYGAAGLFGMTKRALILVGRDGKVRYARTDIPLFRRTAAELETILSKLEL